MKPMRGCKWEDRHETMFPLYGQPKLDGIRAFVSDGYAYTRSLKPVRATRIQSAIRKHRDILDNLDGELIVGDPTAPNCYTRTDSAVMSYENTDADNFSFWVFDERDPVRPFKDRWFALEEKSWNWPHFCILTPTVLLESLEEMLLWEDELLEQGHEGVILRNPNARYKFGNSTPKQGELIKKKAFVDMEGVVIACHEEMENTNAATINALGHTERSGHKANLVPKGTLGALEATINFRGRPSETVRIGTGFDSSQRRLLWQQRDSLIGKIVKFKYFPRGVKDKPRFPTFIGFRDPDDMEQGSLL